jgi:hypothetical protein
MFVAREKLWLTPRDTADDVVLVSGVQMGRIGGTNTMAVIQTS